MTDLGNLNARISTLRYELAKDLNPEPRPLTVYEVNLRKSILNLDGCCEYCGKDLGKKNRNGKGGDHFYSVIKDCYPTEYCDDQWNNVPACSTCNSSKGGKQWKIWLLGKSSKNPANSMNAQQQQMIIDKFTRYDEAMQIHCQRKKVDKVLFDSCINIFKQAMVDVEKFIREHQDSLRLSSNDQVDELVENLVSQLKI